MLIPPNTLHHLDCPSGTMAFLYVNARSRELDALMRMAATRTQAAAFDLSIEEDVIALFGGLYAGTISWSHARQVLDDYLDAPPRQIVDPRVLRTVARLHRDPAARPDLAELAREVQLSPSRLLHLFKQETGVPLRRYRLWAAMGAAMRAFARGRSLTIAAADPDSPHRHTSAPRTGRCSGSNRHGWRTTSARSRTWPPGSTSGSRWSARVCW